MPLFGIVRDSPFIFLGQRLARRIGRAGVTRGLPRYFPSPARVSFGKPLIVFRRGPLDNLLNSPRGEVGRHLAERGTRILIAAKNQVGVKTGRLKASINMRQYRSVGGQSLKIGSPLDYALIHHEGTRPHIITPDRAEFLRFSSRGRVVYTRVVRHPGTKPNKYLADNLYLIR
jgi:hypothetical protein